MMSCYQVSADDMVPSLPYCDSDATQAPYWCFTPDSLLYMRSSFKTNACMVGAV